MTASNFDKSLGFFRSVDSYEDVQRLDTIVAEALSLHDASGFWERADNFVVVKPNWVQESHEYKPDVWEPVITNPALLAAVVKGVARRMTGGGTIVICDAPHTYAKFDSIVARGSLLARLDEIRTQFPKLKLEVLDLRREVWIRKEEVIVERIPNAKDPHGYVKLDLGRDSLFYGFGGESHYYGADYDSEVVNLHHRGEVQEYLLAGTPVFCDLFINLPKLKTHKKTGITCCLKNLVGINGDKNWLPHHTDGSPKSGGDEFPDEGFAQRAEQTIKNLGRKLMQITPGVGNWAYRKLRNTGKRILGDSEVTIRNGNWHGNDTCWRMALDLNRALLYGSMEGTWRNADTPKPYLAIVDGVIGGEGNGPLCPDPVKSGCVIVGTNPAVVDAIAARAMGFDLETLPIVTAAFESHRWPIGRGKVEDVRVDDDREGKVLPLMEIAPAIVEGFRPHFGWSPLRPTKSNNEGKSK